MNLDEAVKQMKDSCSQVFCTSATREIERKLACLGLNSQYGVSPRRNAKAYSKALAEFYSKEREDMDLYDFIRKVREGDGYVVARRDRVNQVDLAIKKVIFNDPATIILWKDGSKTVVKCGDHEKYDPEKGFAMALAKRYLGNMGNYYELFKRHLPEKAFTPDDEVLVRAKLVGPLLTRKGNTKYIVSLPGHTARYVIDEEYLVEVEE